MEKKRVPSKRSNETQTPQEKNTRKKKKTKKSQQQSVSLPVLPHDLIVEILSHLPVKTLIQFRCVSKGFKALISDTQFIKTHLGKIKSLAKAKPTLYERIVPNIRFSSHIESLSLYPIFDDSYDDALELERHSFKKKFPCDWVAGSCDGLLCLSKDQDFVTIMNPSIRVFHKLPHLGFPSKSGSYTVFGFGYDSEIDDYKAVAVFIFPKKKNNEYFYRFGYEYDTSVKVCTLRTNCWRSIEKFGHGTPIFGHGVPFDVSGRFVNGFLNWPVMVDGDSGTKWPIVSFDLSKETYKEVMQPVPDCKDIDKTLAVLDGCLCIMCHYGANSADVWVMKEYGVTESWIKLLTISCLNEAESPVMYSGPYYIADSGEVLLESDSSLFLYNPKDGIFQRLLTEGSYYWYDAKTYIETLVSPKPHN